MRNVLAAYRFMFVLALLAGCASLGLPTPQTFSEKLTAAYGAVEVVNNTAVTLLDAKKITSADGEHILTTSQQARIGLDIARTMAKTDPAAADSKVTAIKTALTAVQTYLDGRE